MANTLLSTVYPPVPATTFATAFVDNQAAKVYFSISSFNTASEIKRVHVSVVNQKTNENVVNTTTGFLLFEGLQYDDAAGMYYIEIPATSIIKRTSGSGVAVTGWNNNQIYAVQLRFDNNNDGSAENTDSYFSDHLANFSEWSSVILLRPIAQPTLLVSPWEAGENNLKTTGFNPGVVPIVGNVTFDSENSTTAETETVQYFEIKITQVNKTQVLFTSGRIYTANTLNPNSLNYLLDIAKLDIENITSYDMYVSFTTKNQYTASKKYNFTITEFVESVDFSPAVTVDMDNENGIAKLTISNPQSVLGTLYVKRSSSIGEFKNWETIREQKVNTTLDIVIEDNTVCSGVWYQYYVQLENLAGGMSPMYKSDRFFPEFYDAIISRKNKQFAVRYNYTISSLKPTVNRQKVDTLGSRYPKFAENAIMNYKQFTIQGLISTQEDEDGKFLTKKEFYGDNYDNFLTHEDTFYRDEYIKQNYNFLWEREFREELTKWLNDGEPKLYRSMTEGIMAVMITDVNLTPNSTLGRRLYTFSATLYEVADGNSLDVLDRLGIYDVITPEDIINQENPDVPEYVEVHKPGQIFEGTTSQWMKNDIIGNYIAPNLKARYAGVLSSKNPVNEMPVMRDVRIQFHSRPHVFYMTSTGNLELVARTAPKNGNAATDPWTGIDTTRYKNKQLVLGYTFKVNYDSKSQPEKKTTTVRDASTAAVEAAVANETPMMTIFVNTRGYYQIPNSVNVYSLCFDQLDDEVTIEYVLDYKEYGTEGTQIKSTTIQKVLVGQQRDIFRAGIFQNQRIMKRYSYSIPHEFIQQMQWWKGICYDVQPYAVLRLLYNGDSNYEDVRIGGTGVFHVMKGMDIKDFCFLGRQMKVVDKSRLRFCDDWECVLDSSVESNQVDETWHKIDGTDTKNLVAVYSDEQKYDIIVDNFQTIAVVHTEEDNKATAIKLAQMSNPQIHTVYQVDGKTFLYYIDREWYEINLNKDKTEGLAKVSIQGNFNYYGQVYRMSYL